jgi:hypothetical protein
MPRQRRHPPLVLKHVGQKRNIGRYPKDDVVAQCCDETIPRGLSIGTPDGQLGQHRIVEHRDLGAGGQPRVDTDPWALRLAKDRNAPRRGEEPARRILGIHAAFDRVSA